MTVLDRAADLRESLAHDIANEEYSLAPKERLAVCTWLGFFERAHGRQQAGLLCDAGCYEQALPLFEQNGVWRKAGDCLWAMGRLDEAAEAYHRPQNRSMDGAFRSGPDYDRLLAMAAVSSRWDQIPSLLKVARPQPIGQKQIVLAGAARAKAPLLRLLALAVRFGASQKDAEKIRKRFGVNADEWAAIAHKENSRTAADLAKQIDKMHPRFLREANTSTDAAIAQGATDRTKRLFSYVDSVQQTFPKMVSIFKDWQNQSHAEFPPEITFWLTEAGIYSIFKTCLHSLRCEVNSWVAPGSADSKFYSAHPWITRACIDDLIHACLREGRILSTGALVSAVLQYLSWELALDWEGEEPGHETFNRVRAQTGWAAGRLVKWTHGEEYAGLFHAFRTSVENGDNIGKLSATPTWKALMEAATTYLDRSWASDFSDVRWKSEHALYLRLRERLAPMKVEQHASPLWLSPQHLDIFLPEKGIAIEYQGEQHYSAIEIFGGEEGFRETVRRDELKRQLCRVAGVRLIEVRFDEDIEDRLLEILRLAEG